MERVLRDKKAVLFFVGPAFLIFICFVFVPIVWSFVYSLYSGMPGSVFNFCGFKNYVSMWSDRIFLDSLFMNLKYVAIVFIGQVGFGLMISSLLFFAVRKFRNVARTIVFLPVILPVVAVGQLFAKMFEITPRYGLVNALLQAMNLNNLIQPWLGQSMTAFIVLCVMDTWTGMGFHSMIMYGGLIEIPSDIMEAAKIDGASMAKLYWHIVLPSIRQVIVTCMVFSLAGTLRLFESSMALTDGGPGTATTSLSMTMFNEAFTYRNYGYGSAIAIFVLVECLVATTIVRAVNAKFEN